MVTTPERTRWMLAGIGATALVAGVLLLFQIPSTRRDPLRAPKLPAGVQMARPTEQDNVLKDETLIRDLRPLFLPTEFNAALAEPRREPGRTILDEERPRWDYSEGELAIGRDLPPVATLNRRPAERAKANDVLATSEVGLGATGFGRGRPKVDALAGRSGFIEVVAVSTGQRILAEELPAGLGPDGDKPWEPMELFAAVDAAGLAAPLIVTEGSRVDEVDAHFRRVLAQVYRIGERLSPGFYRVVVGP